MRRVLVGLTICLAGCAFEHGQASGGGDDDDGAMPGTPRADFDNDGVADTVDNCAAKSNPDQRDHDTDARGDVCDVCPHLPDTGSDADGDGVGDGCDPNPAAQGDQIALFEGFYDAVTWPAVIGGQSWQVQNGALRQSQIDGPAQVVRGANALGEVFIDARLRVNAQSSNAQARRSTGIVVGFADAEHYFFCGLSAQGPYVEVQSGAVSTDWLGNAQYNYAPGQFASGMTSDWLTLQATTERRDGSTKIDCMGHRASTTGTATFYSDNDPSGDIGLRTNGVDASFDYVFVVATGS